MKKTCSKCHLEKLISDFNKATQTKDGLQTICRACQKQWYENHDVQHKANVARIRTLTVRALKDKVLVYLRGHPCVDCKEGDPVVLEFDHVRGIKVASIATMVQRKVSWTKISEEIEKCEVRCANCHRRRTAKQFGFYAFVAQ